MVLTWKWLVQCIVLVIYSSRERDDWSGSASSKSVRSPYASRMNHSWEWQKRTNNISNKAKTGAALAVNIASRCVLDKSEEARKG